MEYISRTIFIAFLSTFVFVCSVPTVYANEPLYTCNGFIGESFSDWMDYLETDVFEKDKDSNIMIYRNNINGEYKYDIVDSEGFGLAEIYDYRVTKFYHKRHTQIFTAEKTFRSVDDDFLYPNFIFLLYYNEALSETKFEAYADLWLPIGKPYSKTLLRREIVSFDATCTEN